ncbi:hypothetical protein [Daejeonella sp. JGW-45]|uniref:hypothetical protein n=1 Tax=Daejeonella sp. JGW-45 TaxID=3034148 RepID=UPI0023EB6900|nr:hypothetical protein [Daejeonella sp. JGW-45]
MGALSYSMFPENGEVHKKKTITEALDIRNTWDRFDSGWYEKLAREGYPQRQFTDKDQETWGFMPLYPAVMSIVSGITGLSLFTSGLLISNFCTFLAMLFLYKLSEEKFGKGIRTVTLLMISAGGFYLNIVYPSGLFVLLTTIVFYFSYKEKFAWALIIAGLASVTRIQGCLLLIIPGIEILLKYRQSSYKFLPAVLLGLLPMISLMFYLYLTSGEPLAFIKIQHAWGSSDLFPLQGFLSVFSGVRPGGSLTNACFWVIILGSVLYCYKRLPLSYIIFTVLYVLISTSNELLYGSARYMLGMLPVFIAISISPYYIRQIFILINILFLSLMISAFVTNTMTFL